VAGRNRTSAADVFEASVLIVWLGYVPAATSTTCPGCATWYARSNDWQRAVAVHGFESDPFVERKTLGFRRRRDGAGTGTGTGAGAGHAAVAALSDARADRLPAASTASMPSVYVVPHTSPLNDADVVVELLLSTPPRYTP